MSTSTFSGPILAGTVRQGAYTNTGAVQLAEILPIQAVAALTTDYGPLYVPANSTITSMTTFTGTAFTGATATITVGSTLGGAEYVASTTVKANAAFAHTLVVTALGSFGTAGSGLMNTAADATISGLAGAPTTPIYVRITQTATTTAVGTATFVVQYIQNV
jgi:tripartite-type tricarboxylate transporter receptor subunit TctC